jgi:hypothetical protein
VQLLLKVFVFAPAGVVLDGQNNDLVVGSINPIINEVGVFSGDELTHVSDGLPPAEFWK